MLTELQIYHKTNWEDYTVLDETLYESEIDIEDIWASDKLVLLALNTSSYNGYNGKGYGVGKADRGITEDESYDIWIQEFRKKERLFAKQIKALGIKSISQSVFDGLMFYYWTTDNILTSYGLEGQYDMRSSIVEKDWDTVASMIMRDYNKRQTSIRAATVLRLADYGTPKDRSWLRTNGIYDIRTQNQLGALYGDELSRARFAYYAETLQFLPLTPNSIKRDIAKRYDETITQQTWIFDGSTLSYSLVKAPSMSPVEKLEIYINKTKIQYEYDYTLENNIFTLNNDSLELLENDIIVAKIKI